MEQLSDLFLCGFAATRQKKTKKIKIMTETAFDFHGICCCWRFFAFQASNTFQKTAVEASLLLIIVHLHFYFDDIQYVCSH